MSSALPRRIPHILYAGSRYVQDGTAEDAFQQDTPEELVRRFPYVIQATTAWDYNKLQAHRHHVGDAAYHVSQMKGVMMLKALEGYIKELGYTALRGVVTPQAAGVAGGIGELGRNGLVINKNFGARIHMPDPILTDLPLVADEPVDIGVEDFCKICRKCANTCPTNSIPFGDKVVHNGIEKYKINWLTCYKLRPYVHDHWGSCLTCAAVCPFTKPNVWWHTMTVSLLHACPYFARPTLVRFLKWIDDKFLGRGAQQPRALGSATTPASSRASTPAPSPVATPRTRRAQRSAATGNVGYYAPLKENTNRFVKRDAVVALRLGPLKLPWLGKDSHKDDPYWDFFINTPPADLANTVTEMIRNAPDGNVFPTKAELHTPEITSSHVKGMAEYFGAELTGIVRLNPN